MELTVKLRQLPSTSVLVFGLLASLRSPRDVEARAMMGASMNVSAEQYVLRQQLVDVLRRRTEGVT